MKRFVVVILALILLDKSGVAHAQGTDLSALAQRIAAVYGTNSCTSQPLRNSNQTYVQTYTHVLSSAGGSVLTYTYTLADPTAGGTGKDTTTLTFDLRGLLRAEPSPSRSAADCEKYGVRISYASGSGAVSHVFVNFSGMRDADARDDAFIVVASASGAETLANLFRSAIGASGGGAASPGTVPSGTSQTSPTGTPSPTTTGQSTGGAIPGVYGSSPSTPESALGAAAVGLAASLISSSTPTIEASAIESSPDWTQAGWEGGTPPENSNPLDTGRFDTASAAITDEIAGDYTHASSDSAPETFDNPDLSQYLPPKPADDSAQGSAGCNDPCGFNDPRFCKSLPPLPEGASCTTTEGSSPTAPGAQEAPQSGETPYMQYWEKYYGEPNRLAEKINNARATSIRDLSALGNSPVVPIDLATGELGVAVDGTVYTMNKDGEITNLGDFDGSTSTPLGVKARFWAYEKGGVINEAASVFAATKNVAQDLKTQYNENLNPFWPKPDKPASKGIGQRAQDAVKDALLQTEPGKAYKDLMEEGDKKEEPK